MEGIGPTIFSCLLLILLQSSAQAQICQAPSRIDFPENNAVDAVVETITIDQGVTLTMSPPPGGERNPFRLDGNRLLAAFSYDYETGQAHTATIDCLKPATGDKWNLVIVVLVTNLNDNPPVFNPTTYDIRVNEFLPVNQSIGDFPATDADGDRPYYTLTSDPDINAFRLTSPTSPVILVNSLLNYDKVKSIKLTLRAQDTPLDQPVVNTASATIMVTIVDVDNRPPWFQPCTPQEVGEAVVCLGGGYTGRVDLNEQQVEALDLDPGPLYAIDGDSGINSAVTYVILNGNTGNLFSIDADTGNITMTKPADVLGNISLTVMAAQTVNTYQFATTTVSISVQVKSLHKPRFQKTQYEAVVTGVGQMAMDPGNKDQPLQILATDDDYAGTGGINPHIVYSIEGSSDFSITGGFLFMMKDLPESTLNLQVAATDTKNKEKATAPLRVQVTSVPSPTTLPSTTSDGQTTESGPTTGDPLTSTSSNSDSTTDPSVTSEGGDSSGATAAPPLTVHVPSGGFGAGEMAAVGATLGVLLVVALGAIGLLVLKLRRTKSDWKKINEANIFRSSLGGGSGGQKNGIQFTNDAFQGDDDRRSSTGSTGPEERKTAEEPKRETLSFAIYDNERSSTSKEAPTPQADSTSEAGSDHSDNDKEVKPILTKERRVDEGYKSVWFKEDITPDAKEEVVIIPDSREDDSEDDEEEEESTSGREDDDDNNKRRQKTSRVAFNDTDLDSGLGVRMDQDSSDEDRL